MRLHPSATVLAALVLLPLALAPLAAAQAGPQVTLDATRAGTTVTADLGASAATRVRLVVGHTDALAGPIVDRALDVDLAAGSTRLLLQGLRADENISVEAEDGQGYAYAAKQLAPAPGARDVPSPVRNVTLFTTNDELNQNEIHAIATDAGQLVVAWRHGASLVMIVSIDDGRSWSAPLTVIDTSEGRAFWQMRETAPGRVTIAFHAVDVDDHPWRFRTVDVAARKVVATSDVTPPQEPLSMPSMQSGIALAQDGSVVVVTTDGSNAAHLARVHADGSKELMRDADLGQPWTTPMVAVDGARIGILAGRYGLTNAGVSLTLSSDGGRTWTPPVHADLPDSLGDTWLDYLGTPMLSADGSLHVAFGANRDAGNFTRVDGYYARLLPNGTLDKQWHLNPSDRDATTPLVATRGARVWLWAPVSNGELDVRESLDGGATFGDAYHLQPQPGTMLGQLNERPPPLILPDGRPVIPGDSYAGGPNDTMVTLAFPFDAQLPAELVPPPKPPAPVVNVTADAPADITVAEGSNVTVRLHVHGNATLPAHVPVTLDVDGGWVADMSVDVPAGQSVDATRALGRLSVGTHDVLWAWGELNTYTHTYVHVQPSRWALTNLDVPARVLANATFDARVDLLANATGGAADVTLLVDGAVANRTTLRVDAGASPTLTMSAGPLAVGTHTLAFQLGDGTSVSTTLDVVDAPVETPLPSTTPTIATSVPAAAPTVSVATPTASHALDTSVTPAPSAPSPSADDQSAPAPQRRATSASLLAAEVTGTVGVAAVAVALVVRTDAGRLALGVAALPLYTRVAPRDVLKNEVRAGIHAYIATHPGTRYEEMRAALGLANGTLVYHLRTLQREGYVRVRREWTRRRYYTPEGMVTVVPRSTAAEDVVRRVREAGALTAAELARELDMSRQLARYHLEGQVRAGALERLPGGVYRAVVVPHAR